MQNILSTCNANLDYIKEQSQPFHLRWDTSQLTEIQNASPEHDTRHQYHIFLLYVGSKPATYNKHAAMSTSILTLQRQIHQQQMAWKQSHQQANPSRGGPHDFHRKQADQFMHSSSQQICTSTDSWYVSLIM